MGKLIYPLLFVASVVAGVAHADPRWEEARSHLQAGATLYDENNFTGALAEFQRAYELAPSYKILFNIAQVDLELQDYAGALTAYARYVKEGGGDIAPARRAQVDLEIERLGGRVGFLVVLTAPGAEVLVDDVHVGYAPLPAPVAVTAGRHRVTIAVPGRDPVTRVFDVAGRQDVTAQLPVEPPVVSPVAQAVTVAPAPPPAPPTRTRMYVAWSLTGGFAIGAGVFAVIAHRDANELAALRSRYPVPPDQLASQRSKTVRDAAVTDACAAAAVMSAGAALYLTVTQRAGQPGPSRDTAVRLQIAPTAVSIAGRF